MEKSFETEVLTRLAVIESKIDDYKLVKKDSETALNKSINNEERIAKLENTNLWIIRTIAAIIIAAIINLIIKK